MRRRVLTTVAVLLMVGAFLGSGQVAAQALGTVLPGQLWTLSHPAIQADAVVEVTLWPQEGSRPDLGRPYVTLFNVAHRDGAVMVPIPPLIDATTGASHSGIVEIRADGHPVGDIVIEPFLSTLTTGGLVLRAVIDVGIDQIDAAIAGLSRLDEAARPSAETAMGVLRGNRARLERQRQELKLHGTLTLETETGVRTLSSSDLNLADTWLLHALVGLDVALRDLSPTGVDGSGARETLMLVDDHATAGRMMRDSWARFQAMTDREDLDEMNTIITELFEGTLETGLDAASRGGTLLFAYVALVSTGASALGGTALALAANALSVGTSLFGGLWSTATAFLTGSNTDAILARDAEQFDSTAAWLSQLIRVGTAYCGAHLPDSLVEKALCTFVNNGLTLKDGLNAAWDDAGPATVAWRLTLDESNFEGCPAREDVSVSAGATSLRIEFDDGRFVAFAWQRPRVDGERLTFVYWIEERSADPLAAILGIRYDGSTGHPILSSLDGWSESEAVVQTLSTWQPHHEIEVRWGLSPTAFLCGDVPRVVRHYRVSMVP